MKTLTAFAFLALLTVGSSVSANMYRGYGFGFGSGCCGDMCAPTCGPTCCNPGVEQRCYIDNCCRRQVVTCPRVVGFLGF